MNSVASFHARNRRRADEQRIKNDEAQMKATPSRIVHTACVHTAEQLLQQLETNLLAARIKANAAGAKYDRVIRWFRKADQEIAQTEAAIADANKDQLRERTRIR